MCFLISLVIFIAFYKWMFLFDISVGNNPPANSGDEGSTFAQEDALEKEMATKINIFACEIPETRSLMGYTSWDGKELDKTYCQNNTSIKNK